MLYVHVRVCYITSISCEQWYGSQFHPGVGSLVSLTWPVAPTNYMYIVTFTTGGHVKLNVFRYTAIQLRPFGLVAAKAVRGQHHCASEARQ